jgi:hypothetical protein
MDLNFNWMLYRFPNVSINVILNFTMQLIP